MVVTNQLSSIIWSKRERERNKNARQQRAMEMIAQALGGGVEQITEAQREKRIIEQARAQQQEALMAEQAESERERRAKLKSEELKSIVEIYKERMKQMGAEEKARSAWEQKMAGEGFPLDMTMEEYAQKKAQDKEDELRVKRLDRDIAEMDRETERKEKAGEKVETAAEKRRKKAETIVQDFYEWRRRKPYGEALDGQPRSWIERVMEAAAEVGDEELGIELGAELNRREAAGD